MAVTPKSARKPAKPAPTLSAREALKAAEAAMNASATPSPGKPAPRKRTTAAKKVDPVAVVAATTAVDSAPEPLPAGRGRLTDSAQPGPLSETLKVKPVEQADRAKPQEDESLLSKAGPVEPILPPAREGAKVMNDVIGNGKKFAEEAKAKLETAYADFNAKAKVGVEKSTKAIEELSDIAKGNVEALVESGKIAAKGFENIGQEAVDYGRKSLEKATASFKSFSTVKTPTEFFQLQSQLFSSSFDELTKEAARSGEALIKLAGDVAQPLTARVTVVTEKVKTLSA